MKADRVGINWTFQSRQTPLAKLREQVPERVQQETASVNIDGKIVSAGMQSAVGISIQKQGECPKTTSTTAFMPMYAHFNSKYTPMGGILVTSSRQEQ